MNAADRHAPKHRHRASPKFLLDVLSHLWASDVHRAAIERLEVGDGDHVVDLGAGLGPATIAASGQAGPAGRVTAIEPSRMMRVAIRIRQALSRNRRRIAVRYGVAEDLPIPDQSVDAVVALNVVHLLQDQQTAACELVRVLKAHGRILFVEEDLEHPAHSFYEPGGHHGAHTGLADGVDTMTNALSAAGLATTTSRVDQFGDQPAHLITATTARTTLVS